jgi:hypothetical protein
MNIKKPKTTERKIVDSLLVVLDSIFTRLLYVLFNLSIESLNKKNSEVAELFNLFDQWLRISLVRAFSGLKQFLLEFSLANRKTKGF